MMQRQGVKALCGIVALMMLAGCSYERYTYVLHDDQGCAYFVTRWVGVMDNNNIPTVPTATWWKGDKAYKATIQRLPRDDLTTCPLKESHNARPQ